MNKTGQPDLSKTRRRTGRSVVGLPSPGEILRDLLEAAEGVTQDRLAAAMKVSRFSVNQIVNGRRAVTAEMAMRLGKVTATSADFWLNLQRSVDPFEAERSMAAEIEKLPVLFKSVEADDFEGID